ncbi:MAG TPA: thioredoxin domain-containing protein [Ktedonobacterales bacterium]|nr:thioredoxin domain-containing protein [Ktedonobacterales bacterium]
MSTQHATQSQHTNRLIHETSPYLLQHAHNPVDWYPWGPEALERAAAENKPIFLSVGYAACHWCHVMAHESFEDPEIARLINESFIPVKVDREERPDIDALYMEAVVQMTGGGGWPMTVFLTPDGAPFFGGTYFPPEDRYGAPAFSRVLASVAGAWHIRRDEVDRVAEHYRDLYRRHGEMSLALPPDIVPAQAQINPDVLHDAADRLLARIDPIHGGFRPAPKFPQAMNLEFLLRMVLRQRRQQENAPTEPATVDDERLVTLLRLTLDKMAGGGIYDLLGGGFHRYSTDTQWLVPHFEKMLYDNALLALVYLHAWQLFGEQQYRRIAEETLDFALRELRHPAGGFFSSLDADSEGEEGKFYVWTPDELRALLSPEDARIAEAAWGVSERGNFEGANILHTARPLADVATELELPETQVAETLARARQTLYDARATRVWPARDEKVLAAWNGLLLRALAEAGRILDRRDYLDAALANASFLMDQMAADGRLHRSWRDGTAKIAAYLEDYAAVINGLLSVYEASGEPRFFDTARAWIDDMLARFWDDDASSFFDTPHDAAPLIGRPRDLSDNATPAGASLAAEALLRLTAYTAEPRYREYAARVLVPLAAAMADQPSGFGHFLCALDDLIGPFHEIAVLGAPADERTQALLRTLRDNFLPRAVIAHAAPDDRAALDAVPLLAGRGLVGGQPAAYVCQSFVCQQPVTTPDALRALVM